MTLQPDQPATPGAAPCIDARIEAIFQHARTLDSQPRAAYLAATCGDDGDLRREIEGILLADGHADRYFDSLAQRIGMNALLAAHSETPGVRQIGAYRLVSLLGRGGMGAVYLAERADGHFEQHVALKIMPIGMTDPLLQQRFLLERQVLARLSHPNIARLLDGGVSEDGTPYFVMEYVAGQPIDAYCARHQLDVTGRLLLFQQVCAAVHYAHQNLIVHRDIKPANVLIDVQGRVKLLDFGVAKLLSDAASSPAPLTAVTERALTPDYASPEQIRGEPLAVTTDVYSLGVLLFELLTDRRPYQVTGESLAALTQAILHADAPSPSRVAPQNCRARLRGDLDAIVLKALDKRTVARYSSVEALAEDIERHLTARPVLARPRRVSYRISKFLKRRRGLVAGIAATAAFLAVVVVQTITSSIAESRQAAALAREGARAAEIRDFLLDIFALSDPNVAKGETITARELLDRSADKLSVDLERQPDTRAAMAATIATIYAQLGLYDRADPLFQQAIAQYRALPDPADAELAAVFGLYARLKETNGQYASAEEFARQSLALRGKQDDAAGLAESLNILGRVLHLQGAYDEAEPLYRRALATYQAEYGDSHESVALSLSHLGALMAHKGDLESAQKFQNEALTIRRKLYGSQDIRLIGSLNNLADLEQQLDHFDQSLSLYQEALAIADKLLPETHSDKAYLYNGLGVVYRRLGRFDDAEANYRRAISQLAHSFGAEHPQVAVYTANLAKLLYMRGKYVEAAAAYRDAYRALAAATPDDPYVNVVRSRLGRALAEVGKHAEAEAHARAAHVALLTAFGVDDKRTQEAHENLSFAAAAAEQLTTSTALP